jgi:hypothetical protein
MLYFTGLLIVSGYIIGILGKLSEKYLYGFLGKKGILASAWLGTPIHELGHALMCILFKHRIDEIKLFNFGSENGVLGYVNHSYNPKNLYERIGNFFIGIGPLLSGTGSLILLLYLLLPKSYHVFKQYLFDGINVDKINTKLIYYIVNSTFILLKSIFSFNNLSNPLFWLFIAAAFSISSHIALSSADIKGAKDGVIALFILVFLTNIFLVCFKISANSLTFILAIYNIHLLSLLIIALLFSVFNVLIIVAFYFLVSNFKIL